MDIREIAEQAAGNIGDTYEIDEGLAADIIESAINTAVESERKRLAASMDKVSSDVCQTLGKVLGYPWFRDDPANFPTATEADGVCVGEHVPETIAAEAAKEIVRLRGAVAPLLALLREAESLCKMIDEHEILRSSPDYATKTLSVKPHIDDIRSRIDAALAGQAVPREVDVEAERVRFDAEFPLPESGPLIELHIRGKMLEAWLARAKRDAEGGGV